MMSFMLEIMNVIQTILTVLLDQDHGQTKALALHIQSLHVLAKMMQFQSVMVMEDILEVAQIHALQLGTMMTLQSATTTAHLEIHIAWQHVQTVLTTTFQTFLEVFLMELV